MITKEITIGTLVEEYPEVVETLLSYGVHCVGCHVSGEESLEQGLQGHGMSLEEVEGVLKNLNKVSEEHRAKEEEAVAAEELSLTLSDAAVARVKGLLASGEHVALRLGVKVGGCSGNEYVFSMEKQAPKTEDLVILQDGAVVFSDTQTLAKISGSVIDYKDALTGAGFTVTNPNATKVCGCGTSFR